MCPKTMLEGAGRRPDSRTDHCQGLPFRPVQPVLARPLYSCRRRRLLPSSDPRFDLRRQLMPRPRSRPLSVRASERGKSQRQPAPGNITRPPPSRRRLPPAPVPPPPQAPQPGGDLPCPLHAPLRAAEPPPGTLLPPPHTSPTWLFLAPTPSASPSPTPGSVRGPAPAPRTATPSSPRGLPLVACRARLPAPGRPGRTAAFLPSHLVELPLGRLPQRRVHGAPQGLDDGVGIHGRKSRRAKAGLGEGDSSSAQCAHGPTAPQQQPAARKEERSTKAPDRATRCRWEADAFRCALAAADGHHGNCSPSAGRERDCSDASSGGLFVFERRFGSAASLPAVARRTEQGIVCPKVANSQI